MLACTCSDWQKQSQSFNTTSFHFCPWCGQTLVNGQPDEALLEKYSQRIKEDFQATDSWGTPDMTNMLVAARSVTNYRQTTGDLAGTLDLMLTFLEMGTWFTNEYGDIDEPYYEGLELMLDDFCELLLANPPLYETHNLSRRLTKLLRAGGDLGWGYGDYLSEQIGKVQRKFGDV